MRQRRFRVVMTLHLFAKLREIDLSLAEFERLLESGELIEEHRLGLRHLKEVVLTVSWTRPLHVVMIVDEFRGEKRVVTAYEPDPLRWSSDFRERRR